MRIFRNRPETTHDMVEFRTEWMNEQSTTFCQPDPQTTEEDPMARAFGRLQRNKVGLSTVCCSDLVCPITHTCTLLVRVTYGSRPQLWVPLQLVECVL